MTTLTPLDELRTWLELEILTRPTGPGVAPYSNGVIDGFGLVLERIREMTGQP
jgi:hypothetical protein